MLFFHCPDMITRHAHMHMLFPSLSHTFTHIKRNIEFKATIILYARRWEAMNNKNDWGRRLLLRVCLICQGSFPGPAASSWKLETHERGQRRAVGLLGGRGAVRWLPGERTHKKALDVREGRGWFSMSTHICQKKGCHLISYGDVKLAENEDENFTPHKAMWMSK